MPEVPSQESDRADWKMPLKMCMRRLLKMDIRKSASLGALVLQTSLLALTTRYSRTEQVTGPRYIASTAVVTSEGIKLLISLYMVLASSQEHTFLLLTKTNQQKFRTYFLAIWNDVFDLREAAKTAIPSGIYILQNNLQFLAVSHLDAATFQVTYQLKILTTAVFCVLFMRRSLGAVRWIALFLLTTGVALAQLPRSEDCSAKFGTPCRKVRSMNESNSPLIGLSAVFVMCVSSGFAGVYFEKILKTSTQTLWAKNVQLSFISLAMGMLVVLTVDFKEVYSRGFFQGYNLLTYFIILQQAGLGLVISLVMKYADNILKGFASSISIILTTIISYVFLTDLELSWTFGVGTALVLCSVLLYSIPKQDSKRLELTVI